MGLIKKSGVLKCQLTGLIVRVSYFMILLVLAATPLWGQVVNWNWAKRAGGNSGEMGTAVSVDRFGNRFATGYYMGNITFGSFTLTNSGWYDIFTVKYDTAGVVQWAKKSIGNEIELSGDIVNDYNGNTIVTGYFNGASLNFSGTIIPGYGQGNKNGFIVKYDPAGTVLWGACISPFVSNEDNLNAACDNGGNIIVAGTFSDTVHFGTTTLIGQYEDVFVAKYDASGNLAWAVMAGGPGISEAFAVTTDSLDNIYVTGHYTSTITMGSTTLTAAGGNDMFIAKLDPSGNFLWARSAGGISNDVGTGIDTDSTGNIYVAGRFYDSITFGSITIPSTGVQYHGFLAMYNPAGTVLWANKISSNVSAAEYCTDVAVTADGNPIVSGMFESQQLVIGSAVFNNNDPAVASADLFVAKYSQTGNPLWARSAAGNHSDALSSIAAYGMDQFYITGGFRSTTLTFGATTLTNALNNQTNYDFYIAGAGAVCNTSYSSFSVSSCDSYTSPSGNHVWTTSGIFTDTVSSVLGCDSILTINLTILTITPAQISGSSPFCPGQTMTLSTTASYATYLWSTGSTGATINITTPGVYTVYVAAANGCMDTATATVGYSPNSIVTITASGPLSFCQGDSVILSANAALANYQWYRHNQLIPGAVSQNYIAKIRGNYKCIGQSAAMCPDTSNILNVKVPCMPTGPDVERIDLNSSSITPQMHIFPNPARGNITVAAPSGYLEIFNTFGELMYAVELNETENSIDVSGFADGIYLVTVKMNDARLSEKVVLLK